MNQNQPWLDRGDANPASPPAESSKLAYVDVLRGIAILLVIVAHVGLDFGGTWIPNATTSGQLGVQLFFVASAFTLCRSWQARAAAEHSPYLNFFLRRFFRIAPLYYLAILGYSLLHWPLADGWQAIVANVFFIHGLTVVGNNSVVPGGWSIGTEFAFYAIFPLTYKIVARLTPHDRIWALPAAGVLAMVIVGVAFMNGRGGQLFYFAPNQFIVFVFGIYAWCRRDERFSERLAWTAFVMSAAVCVLIMNLMLEGLFDFRSALILPAISGLCFFFLLTIARQRRWNNRFLVRIGQLSFSLYVVHFLFAEDLFALITRYIQPSVADSFGYFTLTLAVVLAASIGLATLTKTLIEDRFIALGNQFIRNREQRLALFKLGTA
ncbi:MAG: acyltransferase [Nitrobacter sp.]